MEDAAYMPKGQITEISEWLLRDDIRLSTEDSPKASGKSASQVVQSFSVEGGPAPEVDFGTTNWVGRLTEYRQANPHPEDSVYIEDEIDSKPVRFTCTVRIPEAPENTFGSTAFSFANKKDAKRFASKEAIEWLVTNNHMPSIECVKVRKPGVKAKPAPSPKITVIGGGQRASGQTTSDKSKVPEQSYAQQVVTLAARLGLQAPIYVINQYPDAPHTSAMYNGYAEFRGDLTITDKLGVFRGQFGRKRAKEHCAKEVLAFLKVLESRRLGGLKAPSGNQAEIVVNDLGDAEDDSDENFHDASAG